MCIGPLIPCINNFPKCTQCPLLCDLHIPCPIIFHPSILNPVLPTNIPYPDNP